MLGHDVTMFLNMFASFSNDDDLPASYQCPKIFDGGLFVSTCS